MAGFTEDRVVLVDRDDHPVGTMDKMDAHRTGALHRAFSVFVFDSRGRLLLQQRAQGKYHSAGLWTNTCCSHPRPGESVLAAAQRRLNEEMGMTCELKPGFTFVYRADFANGLIEYEFDHVLFGTSDQAPVPVPAEVAGFRYATLAELARELAAQPDQFTVWLATCLPQVIKHRN